MNDEGIGIYDFTNTAERKILDVLARIRMRREKDTKESPSKTPFSVGRNEKRLTEYADINGITLATPNIYMSDDRLSHATRASKTSKGLTVSDEDLASFPSRRYKMKLYYDSKNKNFVYQDGKNKYIVHPNYEVKVSKTKTRHVMMITASIITDINEFNMKKYKEIK